MKILALIPALAFAACATSYGAADGADGVGGNGSKPSLAGLEGTSWQLVAFESSDDAQGITRPGEGREYTLTFGADNALTMKLDCNRGRASWNAANVTPTGGSLMIGPVAGTKALCPQPDMGEKLLGAISNASGYIIRDGNLFIALKMDSGIYEFTPM